MDKFDDPFDPLDSTPRVVLVSDPKVTTKRKRRFSGFWFPFDRT